MEILELAQKIDDACDNSDENALKNLLEKCDELLNTADCTNSHEIYYFKANIYAGISQTKYNDEYAWSWLQSEAVEELFYLRKAITDTSFAKADSLRRSQVRTNLANRLNSLGRSVEALEQWSLVINECPNFAMALGNRAGGKVSYSQHLYDPGHQAIVLASALPDLNSAVSAGSLWDSGPYQAAHDKFERDHQEITDYLEHIKYDYEFDMDGFPIGESPSEEAYRRWCLNEGLFLNPINDVSHASVAATDVFHLPSHVYKIGESPRFPVYFNLMKQEYVSARYRLFKSLDYLEGHFIDRNVLITDNADGAEYGYHIDQIKSAYRSAYSIFDKIALFLNDYFDIGMKVRDVYFRNIWFDKTGGTPKALHPVFKNSKNWPLRGLYYLSKDIFDKEYSENALPDARELSNLRNRAEHRFLTLQCYKSGDENTDYHSYITLDEFSEKTFRIMRMARAGLIYLSLAMHREEVIRAEGNTAETSINMPYLSRPIMRPWDFDSDEEE